MKLTIQAINRKPIQTKYGMKNKVGIKTAEYGEQWLNGWEDQININWQKGMAVEADISQDAYGYKFKAQPSVFTPTLAPTPKLSGGTKEKETDWDRISWGKCKTLFLVEAYKMGKDLAFAEPQAEAWADAAMRELEDPDNNQSDDDDEIRVENIPF